MREVLPGVYEWSWFSAEKQIDFNGHFVVADGDRVLIAPPPLSEADWGIIGDRSILLGSCNSLRVIA